MEKLAKLRLLIWDKESTVFADPELEEFLQDNNEDVYGAAATCLNVVRANPEKYRSYSLGPLNFTYEDLDRAIEMYKSMAATGLVKGAGGGVATTRMRRQAP